MHNSSRTSKNGKAIVDVGGEGEINNETNGREINEGD